MTDAAQQVVARYDYDAFGHTIRVSGTLEQPYRFSTKRQIGGGGLLDYGFRFYSPNLGRFINRDPIGEAGGLNLYGFVGNDPVNYADPHGLLPIFLIAVVAYRVYNAYGTAMDVKETWETWHDPCAGTMTRLLSAATTIAGLIPGGKHAGRALNAVDDAADAGRPLKNVDLTDAKGRTHILDGDATGGGHGAGRGRPGKSEFPADWSDDSVIDEISDIATDPRVPFSTPNKRGYSIGKKNVDGVDIKVVVDQTLGRIVTGYPTNLKRNP